MVLITDDDTVMMIKEITLKTITTEKTFFLPLLRRIEPFIFDDVKSKYVCGCHLVPYGMLRD